MYFFGIMPVFVLFRWHLWDIIFWNPQQTDVTVISQNSKSSKWLSMKERILIAWKKQYYFKSYHSQSWSLLIQTDSDKLPDVFIIRVLVILRCRHETCRSVINIWWDGIKTEGSNCPKLNLQKNRFWVFTEVKKIEISWKWKYKRID